jgi:type IV pilus assembly protein PilM
MSAKNIPSAVVGLDIGNDSIKVVEARFGKDGIVITGLGVAPTPAETIENEVIVDPKTLGLAVKRLLAESGIKTKTCVSAVAGQSKVVVRVIEVPKMDQKELSESMKWEVERQVPFAAADIEMDYALIESETDDANLQTMEVLLAVAQRDLVDGHVSAVQAAGLKPVAIDVGQLAAERALIEVGEKDPTEEVVAILSIGAQNTEMGIFDNGTLSFPCPPIPIAGATLTREISEALGIPIEDAEKVKKEYAFVDLEGFAPVTAEAEEPTEYDTAYGPGSTSSTPFDGDVDSLAVPTGASGADLDFGVSYHDQNAGPSFDLNADPEAASASAVTLEKNVEPDLGGFDLGEEIPVAPEDGAAGIVPVESAQTVQNTEEQPIQSAGQTSEPAYDLSEVDGDDDSVIPLERKILTQEDTQTGERVFNAISGALVDLANEIRRSLDYYSVRYAKAPTKVYLCGGTARIQNLAEFLARELGIPVVVANPFEKVRYKLPSMSDSQVKDISALFVVSVGLAIRDMVG